MDSLCGNQLCGRYYFITHSLTLTHTYTQTQTHMSMHSLEWCNQAFTLPTHHKSYEFQLGSVSIRSDKTYGRTDEQTDGRTDDWLS